MVSFKFVVTTWRLNFFLHIFQKVRHYFIISRTISYDIITWLSVAFQEWIYISLREISRMENYGIITTKISHAYVNEAEAHWTAGTGWKRALIWVIRIYSQAVFTSDGVLKLLRVIRREMLFLALWLVRHTRGAMELWEGWFNS